MGSEKLFNLEKAVEECRRCLLHKTGENMVFGEGPENAGVMLVGQNPGAREDETGRPFVGRSGSYLDKVLKKNNISREKLYVTSIVKHKTPGNRKPSQKEINACLPYLEKQISLINPELVVLMGKVAGETPRSFNTRFFETIHPAAAMRFPRYRKKFLDDFKKISDIIHSK